MEIVIVVVPIPTALTVPLTTVATPILLELHFISFEVYVASEGEIVGVSVISSPTFKVSFCLSSVMDSIGIVTVTLHVAVFSSAWTVIFACPLFTAVTFPF